MNKFGALITIGGLYLGGAALGVLVFGEGMAAALTGGVIGTVGLVWIANNIKE